MVRRVDKSDVRMQRLFGARSRLSLRQLFGDRKGIAAVEFALILPLMLTLYFGAVELGDALTINRKVSHVTSSLADLVTQSKVITDSDMSNILDAAASVMTPYSVTPLKIVVSGVTIDTNGKATVTWSDASNTSALTPNSVVTLPAAVSTPSTFLVMAKVIYAYKPVIGYVMSGTFNLSDQFYLRPRLTTAITRTSS